MFGTNPLGIEYDGQVSGEGQTSGTSNNQQSGTGGSQRGSDRLVQPQLGRRLEREVLRSPSAAGKPRSRSRSRRCATPPGQRAPGASTSSATSAARTSRCSSRRWRAASTCSACRPAAKLNGLDLPPRRDIKVTPYALGVGQQGLHRCVQAGNQPANPFEDRNIGIDAKWGIRPNLTADFTINTDFAQVEADEEQVNLTRFDLFFPEKRGFFLENASVFQFGAPQLIDLFFSRRIGLSATGSSGVPIDIIGGARLSGKVGPLQRRRPRHADGGRQRWANRPADHARQQLRRDARAARSRAVEFRRHLREPRRHRQARPGDDNYNRAYGVDANLQVSPNAKLFAFIARTDSPQVAAERREASGYSGRVFYNFTNNIWQVVRWLLARRQQLQPRSRVPAAARLPASGVPRVLPAAAEALAVDPPHLAARQLQRLRRPGRQPGSELDGALSISSRFSRGRAAGSDVRRSQCRIARSRRSRVFNAGGKRVVIPAGFYSWNQVGERIPSATRAPRSRHDRVRHGGFYDGDFNAIETTVDLAGRRAVQASSATRGRTSSWGTGNSTPISCR